MMLKLDARTAKLLEELHSAGWYQSRLDVVKTALRLLRDRDAPRGNLRKKIQEGIDQAERGESAPFDPEEIKREGRKLLKLGRLRRGR